MNLDILGIVPVAERVWGSWPFAPPPCRFILQDAEVKFSVPRSASAKAQNIRRTSGLKGRKDVGRGQLATRRRRTAGHGTHH